MVHAFGKLCLKTEIACLPWSVFNSPGEENDIKIRYSCHLIKLPQILDYSETVPLSFSCGPKMNIFRERKEENQIQEQRLGVSRRWNPEHKFSDEFSPENGFLNMHFFPHHKGTKALFSTNSYNPRDSSVASLGVTEATLIIFQQF